VVHTTSREGTFTLNILLLNKNLKVGRAVQKLVCTQLPTILLQGLDILSTEDSVLQAIKPLLSPFVVSVLVKIPSPTFHEVSVI
jgi:hypothetical protein